MGACVLFSAACTAARTHSSPEAVVRQPVVEGHLYPDAYAGSLPTDSSFGVRVTVHGRSFLLAVDHGADITELTDSALISMHITPRLADVTRVKVVTRKHPGETLVADSTATSATTVGDSLYEYWGPIHDVRIDTLRMGSAVETNLVQILSSPGSDGVFDGLLGRDILSHFDIEFDVAHGVVRLYDPDPHWLPPPLRARDCVAVRPKYKFPVDSIPTSHEDSIGIAAAIGWNAWTERQLELPLTVAGRQLSAEFDSGINETMINWTQANEFGPRVQLGDHRLAPVPVRIAELKFETQTSTPNVPQILIG